MKKYYMQRPTVGVMVKWEGNNVAEFEQYATDVWNNEFATYTFVDNAGDLEVWLDSPWGSPYKIATIELNQWFDGSGSNSGVLADQFQEVTAEGPHRFAIEEDV